jgi:hypothetical protein
VLSHRLDRNPQGRLLLGAPSITADRQINDWNERHARLQIIRADSLVA